MHSRIEKSAFRKGEYTGYCDGVWHIKQLPGKLWIAHKMQQGANHSSCRDYFKASSLEKINKGLEERANIAMVAHHTHKEPST
jgi:hypothetical protein